VFRRSNIGIVSRLAWLASARQRALRVNHQCFRRCGERGDAAIILSRRSRLGMAAYRVDKQTSRGLVPSTPVTYESRMAA